MKVEVRRKKSGRNRIRAALLPSTVLLPISGRAFGAATALALASILAFATGVTGFAAALALAAIFARAAMRGRAVIGQLALGDPSALIGRTGRGGLDACGRSGQKTGQGNGREHGFGCLQETWIFHLCLSIPSMCLVGLPMPGAAGQVSHYRIRRTSWGIIPSFYTIIPQSLEVMDVS